MRKLRIIALIVIGCALFGAAVTMLAYTAGQAVSALDKQMHLPDTVIVVKGGKADTTITIKK